MKSCQDVSHAGKRAGLRPDTRSGLWSQMAYAIDQLRPGLVVAENVRGLLSAEAASDLEPCAWCLGDGAGSPLRALGAVLGDLAELGYDADWYGVRASDAGAPHGRFRVFIFAWPAADADRRERRGRERDAIGSAVERATPAGSGEGGGRGAAPADADQPRREGPESARGRVLPAWGAPTDAQGDGRHEGWPEPAGQLGRPDAAERGDAPADTEGHEQRESAVTRPLRPEPRDGASGPTHWGDYEPAIRRWERLTRPAPAPTQPGKNGQPRLSPAFVEWLMGLPAGHVTDPAIGLSRNEQLKCLGNGVVPAQAALATRLWLSAMSGEVAA